MKLFTKEVDLRLTPFVAGPFILIEPPEKFIRYFEDFTQDGSITGD